MCFMLDSLTTSVANGAGALGPVGAFWWAAGGSFALEVISLYNEIKAQKSAGLPAYYKSWVFWLVRLAVTAIAGALAVAEEASSKLLAINIGASAPAILQLLASRPPSGREDGK
jgi:hypothetical protein